MNLIHYLFGFGGRINRAKQWAILIVAFVFFVVEGFAFSFTVGFVAIGDAISKGTPAAQFFATPEFRTFLLAALLIYLLMYYIGLAVGAKRLHDRNRSAWWLLVFFALPLVLNIPAYLSIPDQLHYAGQALSAARQHLPAPPQPMQSPLATIGNGAATIIGLWAFVELFCLRGTIGDNRFGPDPLAGQA